MKVVALSLLSAAAASPMPSWDEYKAKFGYNFNGDEDVDYENQYNAGVKRILAKNAKLKFKSGVNQFTVFTTEYFQEHFTGELADPQDVPVFKDSKESVALTVGTAQDWSSDTSVVNPVKNQGGCGSCWTFGAAGVLESTYALATGTLYSLSEQQIMDCAPSSEGCQVGGLSRNPLNDYYPGTGACDDTSYPYTASDTTCADTSCNIVIPAGVVTGYAEIATNTADLQTALLERPIKVSVFADDTWQDYENDIAYPTECYDHTNHAVIAVGFEAGSYWKIRNSWGTGWGESGYIRLTQDSDCSGGPSGLWGRTPIYPTLNTMSVSV